MCVCVCEYACVCVLKRKWRALLLKYMYMYKSWIRVSKEFKELLVHVYQFANYKFKFSSSSFLSSSTVTWTNWGWGQAWRDKMSLIKSLESDIKYTVYSIRNCISVNPKILMCIWPPPFVIWTMLSFIVQRTEVR